MILNPNIAIDFMAFLIILFIYISGKPFKNDKGISLLTVLEIMMLCVIVTDIFSCFFSDNYFNEFTYILAFVFTSLLDVAHVLSYFFVAIAVRKWLDHENVPPDWFKALSIMPVFAMIVLMIVNIFNNCIFGIDFAKGKYYGQFHFMADGLVAVYIVYGFIVAFVDMLRSKDDRKVTDSFKVSLFLMLPVIGLIAQRFFEGIDLVIPFSALSILLVYVNIFLKITKEYQSTVEKQNNELQEIKTGAMISQIQPHFLFNSLTAIMRLCDTDPEAAKKAIADFSDYLRLNIDSIRNKQLIPLDTEINHIDIYFEFEKLRFGDKLKFEKDISVSDFFVPPLSIQPLVENAIKHGINKKKEGGTVVLSTFETDTDYCIQVKDDGVGFKPGEQSDTTRAHVGMDNVTTRLKYMCNGKMIVESEIGAGTTVSVLIPKENCI